MIDSEKGKKSVFSKILISYVLMVLIPVASLGSILYYYNVINYRKDIELSNISKLNQIKNQMDSELKKLKDVTYHISTNTEILDTDMIAQAKKKQSAIVSQIQAYTENHAFVDDILFYFRGDKYIYTNQGKYYYHDFENNAQNGWELDWWRVSFFGNLNKTIAAKAMRIGADDQKQFLNNRLLVLMHPVPYLSTLPKATIAYTIKEEMILAKVENFFGDFNGKFFVYDEFYNLVVSNVYTEDNIKNAIWEKECRSFRDTGIFDVNMNGNRYIGMRIVSEEMAWSYIVIMPYKHFFKSVAIMRRTILQIIFMVIIIGSIIAFIVSRQSYRPINALVSYIKNQDIQQTDDMPQNEFDIIRYSFEKSYEKNRKLIVQMNTQNSFVRDQCLVKILRGNFKDDKDLDYLLKCSNLNFQGIAYFAIVLSTNIKGISNIRIEHLLSVLEDIFFIGARGYGVELVQEKMIGIIISIEEGTGDFNVEQNSIVKDILSLIKSNFEVNPVMGVGEIYKDIMHLNFSFLEALSALYGSSNDNNTNIFFFSQMKDEKNQLSYYPIQEQSLYIESLKQGNKKVAQATLEQIVKKIAHNVNSYFMIKCTCFDMLNNLIKSIDKEHIEKFSENIKQAATTNTIYEFQEVMGSFTGEFCDYIIESEKEKDNKLKEDLIKFVNQNFISDQISLDLIASKFDISPTYASKFFREETGINFIDYLTNVRMEYAKDQLRKTDKLIKDIAEEIGYTDASSFSRKFRSVEGITPGQYRDITK